MLQRAGGKLCKMGRDHGLVGGHHVLSGLEGAHDEGVGRLDAAHALHDDADLGVRDDVLVLRGHAGVAQAIGQLEDAGDLDVVHALADDLVDSASDGAIAEKGDLHVRPIFQVCVHGATLKILQV